MAHGSVEKNGIRKAGKQEKRSWVEGVCQAPDFFVRRAINGLDILHWIADF
jgi:hypothetical protein